MHSTRVLTGEERESLSLVPRDLTIRQAEVIREFGTWLPAFRYRPSMLQKLRDRGLLGPGPSARYQFMKLTPLGELTSDVLGGEQHLRRYERKGSCESCGKPKLGNLKASGLMWYQSAEDTEAETAEWRAGIRDGLATDAERLCFDYGWWPDHYPPRPERPAPPLMCIGCAVQALRSEGSALTLDDGRHRFNWR